MPLRTSGFSTASKSNHIDDHTAVHRSFNAIINVIADPDYAAMGDGETDDTTAIQAAFDAGGAVFFPAGTYIASALTITSDISVDAAPGVTLVCPGISVDGSAAPYKNVTMRNLTILNDGTGDIGLSLNSCLANLQDVTVRGYNEVGLLIEYGISSRFEGVSCKDSPVAMKISGDISTTLSFSRCTFHAASTAAVQIEAEVNSVNFTDWCVFQSSAKGLVIDSAQNVSLINPYFENIAGLLIDAGSTAEVQSIVMVNPFATGGAANDTGTGMFLFDRVQRLGWFGGGDCRITKTSWIKTTTNLAAAVVHEPRNLGIGTDFANAFRVLLFRSDGRLGSPSFQVNQWNLQSSYAWIENDIALAYSTYLVFYATPTGVVRIAGQNVEGVLTGGLEVDNSGPILRSPNGTRYRIVVDNDGNLSTAAP